VRPRSIRHGTGRGDRVQLVRVVEDSGLRGSRCARIVMARDRVEELGGSVQALEETEPEVDVAEQATLLGRCEDGRPSELPRPPDIMDERSGEQEVAAEPWVDLDQLAAEGRDTDRVLEQSAGVRMMAVRSRRK